MIDEGNRTHIEDLSLDDETPKDDEVDLCKGNNSLYCMNQAIHYFELDRDESDEGEKGHFGLGKSLLMYIEIQIKEGMRKSNKQRYFESHEEQMQD